MILDRRGVLLGGGSIAIAAGAVSEQKALNIGIGSAPSLLIASKFGPISRPGGMTFATNAVLPIDGRAVDLTLNRGVIVDSANPSPYAAANEAFLVDSPVANVVFHGSSITQGFGAFGDGYVAQWQRLLWNSKLHSVNLLQRGIGGQGHGYVYISLESLLPLNQEAAAKIDVAQLPHMKNFLHVMDGISDDIWLTGGGGQISGAQAWALMLAYINARVVAGWDINRIVVGTLPARQNNAYAQQFSDYRALVLANAATMGFLVADYANLAQLQPSETSSIYYSPDMTHPSILGCSYMATCLYEVLAP